MKDRYDVVIVGGGHNGLVAAAYLGRAGKSVLVLEALDTLGGATASVRTFPGMDARLSRYSYLVSLLPDRIIRELGLNFTCASRIVSSYTPVQRHGSDTGLFVGRGGDTDAETAASFRSLTGSDQEWKQWQAFYDGCTRVAETIAPTLLEPLLSRADTRARLGDDALWDSMMERPIGESIEEHFTDDLVQGVVLTDALIGSFSHAHDPSLLGNRCFLYHVVGNGTGEWKVPVGGMGALVEALLAACLAVDVEVHTSAPVEAVHTDGTNAEVVLADGQRVAASYVLSNAAPKVLSRLLGEQPVVDSDVEGCQLKINMLLHTLPRLRSGADPRQAFAGTLHIDESAQQLQHAYDTAASGILPDVLPGEVYCHTLTDPSILGPELRESGHHTLTLFGLHAPAALFDADHDAMRAEALKRSLAGINAYFEDPIESCLALDANGEPCVEVKSPLDLEHSVHLPRGNIFHRPLTWPFATTDEQIGQWGGETKHANIFVCGAGSIRGGAVSGIPGHNAAKAVLEREVR
jgi:phytoene dehydrogenase-like protein